MKCTIEAKILPLAGVSGHLYLEVFDEAGKRIAQVNGFATSAKTGDTRSLGLPGDLIKAYLSCDHGGIVLAASYRCGRDDHAHNGCALFEGTRAEVDLAIDAMRKRAAEINAEKAPYLLLSLNSNTVFSEMVTAAETVVPVDRKALDVLLASKITLPGVATDFTRAVAALKAAPPKAAPKPPKL